MVLGSKSSRWLSFLKAGAVVGAVGLVAMTASSADAQVRNSRRQIRQVQAEDIPPVPTIGDVGVAPPDTLAVPPSEPVAAVADSSFVDSPAAAEDGPWELVSLFDDGCGGNVMKDNQLKLGGWGQFGYTNESDGVFNNYPDQFNLHQGNVFFERATDRTKDFDWGFRVDALYGIDAQNTQAFGNNPGKFDFQNGFDHGQYGWAIPQLYAEVSSQDWSIKGGHFYTPMGYEVVPATGNFFYSHSLTMNFGEAFTHTGALGSYKVSDKLEVYGGWTLGWDTGFDQFNGGSNFLGGFAYQVTDKSKLTYITTAGNLGVIGEGYAHSIVLDNMLTDKWQYVLQSDLVHTNQGVFGGSTFNTIGINNFLFYTLTDKTKIGGRAEWWKLDSTSYYVITAGVNYKPIKNLTFRPEIRYQWSPAGEANNNAIIPVDETIAGIDMVFTF